MPVLATAPHGVEVLDHPNADPALVRRMLTDIVRANRWLGGVAALEAGLHFLLGATPRGAAVTLLDVGTGAGDLPRAAQAWSAARHITMRGFGIERHRAAARLACGNGVACVVACGSALPFRSEATGDVQPATTAAALELRHQSPVTRRGIDIVLISQLLHHFDDAAAVTVIREAAAVARRGVILSDLRPMRGASTAFRVAGRALRFHPTTVSDGIVSMARGRDARALGALARRAGAVHLHARNLPMARVLVAFRTDS